MAAIELTRVEGKEKSKSRTLIKIFDSDKIDKICDYLHDCELCTESVLQYVKSGDSLTIAWEDVWLGDDRMRILLLKTLCELLLDEPTAVEYTLKYE